ncbi:hypothetical protein ACJRO7_028418 [Eucalyptus globulus]|uniref:Uncharacterized protein n=1 Tax=Eucalyptus globulus TaxID=34317 RepID=A0ABD3JV33_EUCGL
MERRKTFHLLAIILSLLMIEKSMASQILAENNPAPDHDKSRIRVNGSVPDKDGSWSGNSSGQGKLMVPPPSTSTTIDVKTAVSPTSATSKTSVNKSSNTSSTTVTNGGTVSRSSSTGVSKNSSTGTVTSGGTVSRSSSSTRVSQSSSATNVSQSSSSPPTQYP